jgi:hypothetical protein
MFRGPRVLRIHRCLESHLTPVVLILCTYIYTSSYREQLPAGISILVRLRSHVLMVWIPDASLDSSTRFIHILRLRRRFKSYLTPVVLIICTYTSSYHEALPAGISVLVQLRSHVHRVSHCSRARGGVSKIDASSASS